MLHTRTRPLALGCALAAGLLALGAKLALIHAYGSDVPFYDEWDAIGKVLLLPRGAGELHLANFLAPQNEHRIVLTRLLDYGLLAVNRQWDPLLEMTAGAVLHSAFLVALVLFARRMSGGWRFAGVTVLLALLFVVPFDWENTLQGLQAQFYFLEWCTLGMFLLCLPSRPLSARWWCGFLVGVASLGSMSSGFLAAGVVLMFLAAQALLSRGLTARDATAAALLAALCIAGVLGIAHPPGDEALRATSAWEWLVAVAASLSWPEMAMPYTFLVLQLPVAVLVWRRLRERRIGADEVVLAALAAWTWLQVAAVAYARANHGMIISPRYMDLFAVGSAANAIALARLGNPSTFRRRPQALFAVLWLSVFACGLWTQGRDAFVTYLDQFPGRKAAERQNVRLYLATGEASVLRNAKPGELPYPDEKWLEVLLGSPAILDVLPVGIRPSVPLTPKAGSAGFKPAPLAQLQAGASGRVWVARSGPAKFVSEPFPAGTLPFLHFSVAGSPDLSAAAVRLESEGGTVAGPARPLHGEEWIPFDLALPGEPTVRLAVDVPPGDHWLAFSGPVELGRLSWADRWLLRRSKDLEWAAAALLAAAVAVVLLADAARLRQPAGE